MQVYLWLKIQTRQKKNLSPIPLDLWPCNFLLGISFDVNQSHWWSLRRPSKERGSWHQYCFISKRSICQLDKYFSERWSSQHIWLCLLFLHWRHVEPCRLCHSSTVSLMSWHESADCDDNSTSLVNILLVIVTVWSEKWWTALKSSNIFWSSECIISATGAAMWDTVLAGLLQMCNLSETKVAFNNEISWCRAEAEV